ncbi:hypothetical protein bcgnr5390_42730 [Bacillus luti]
MTNEIRLNISCRILLLYMIYKNFKSDRLCFYYLIRFIGTVGAGKPAIILKKSMAYVYLKKLNAWVQNKARRKYLWTKERIPSEGTTSTGRYSTQHVLLLGKTF